MDALGRYVVILLSVVLILLFPLQYIAQAQQEVMDGAVSTITTEFTDLARHQGYITVPMYEELIHKLDRTGQIYDISLEVAHPISGKEHAENNPNFIKNVHARLTYFNDNHLLNDSDHIHILEQGSKNTLKSLFLNNEIQTLATHIHTSNCYVGHNHTASGCSYHTHSGSSSSYGGCYTVPYSEPYSYTCGSCNGNGSRSCPGGTVREGSVYYGSGATYCSSCKKNPSATVTWYKCNTCEGTLNKRKVWDCSHLPTENDYGSHSSISCSSCSGSGKISGTTTYYSLGCGMSSGYNCGYYNIDYNPLCGQVVISIVATNPTQTVDMESSIVTTATATYLDGHTGAVNCTSNFDPSKIGAQTVTLTYTGLVGNARTNGTRTSIVQVTVKPLRRLTGITVIPLKQTIERYKNPKFTVTATYDDGSSNNIINYSITNFNNTKIGSQLATFTYSEDGIAKTTTATVNVTPIKKVCPDCGSEYFLDENDQDNGCPYCVSIITGIKATPDTFTILNGQPLPITVEALFQNGSKTIITDWTSYYDSLSSGYQEVTITYQGFTTKVIVYTRNVINCPICNKEYSLNDDGTDPGCPYCREEVASIWVTPREVFITKNQELPITVTASYKDGHTSMVDGWTTTFVADTVGTYNVAISYQSAKDIITVTVQPDDLIHCPYCGLDYSFQESPNGCPICYETLVGIDAALRNGGNTVQIGKDLDLELTLIFQDTHREIAYTGWTVEGFQRHTLGVQTVTIKYQTISTTLTVEVINALPKIICPIGHEYYLNEDGTDPGCPFCDETQSKDNEIVLLEITYTPEILEALYQDGIYSLNQGDYITVTITPRNTSLRSRLQLMFFGTSRKVKEKTYVFGGEVI